MPAPLRDGMPPLAPSSASARRALTLVEVVAATLIVGMMSVAALNSLGAATRSAESTGNRAVALGLANELMTEILATSYDDLDTFHNRDEQLLGDRAHWRRLATVETIDPANPTQTVGVDQGAKRIRVTIEHDDQALVELSAIKTKTE